MVCVFICNQVVIYRAFSFFLLHNHIINIEKKSFSGEVKESVIFPFVGTS
jgi:hypothetical protein